MPSSLLPALCAMPGEGSKDASGSLGCTPSGDDCSVFPGRDVAVAYAGQLLSWSEWVSVLWTGLWGGSSRRRVYVSMGFHDPHLESAPGLALKTLCGQAG